MIEPFKVLVGALCGVLVILAAGWNLHVIANDRTKYQAYHGGVKYALIGTAIISSLALVGCTTFGILAAFDPATTAPFGSLALFVLTVVGVCLAFTIKAVFSTIVLGLTIAWAIYSMAVHGSWSLVPLFAYTIDWIAPKAPPWVYHLYVIACLTNAVAGAVSNGMTSAWEHLTHRFHT